MSQGFDLADIKAMSVPERILIVEEIWDSIAAEQDSLEVTQAQKDELDRRLAAHDADPNRGSSWDEVKARLQDQR
jgi:putative addiction module component (TIGR02574 family)